MAYNALSVAKHVVSYCCTQKKPISNLKLQKIMYYAWVDYYKEVQASLYDDNICAWQLGPVVPEVYYEFCSFAGTPIVREFPSELNKNDIMIVNKIIDRYIDASASSLVSKTHQKGTPWEITYRGGAGARDVIPFSLVKSLECDHQC